MNQLAKNAISIINDARWLHVLVKDATADGTFYFSVSTIGVYASHLAPRAQRGESMSLFIHALNLSNMQVFAHENAASLLNQVC